LLVDKGVDGSQVCSAFEYGNQGILSIFLPLIFLVLDIVLPVFLTLEDGANVLVAQLFNIILVHTLQVSVTVKPDIRMIPVNVAKTSSARSFHRILREEYIEEFLIKVINLLIATLIGAHILKHRELVLS
jgi:hypothetical protein